MQRRVLSPPRRPELVVARRPTVEALSTGNPRGLHLDLAERVAGEAWERARRVGFQPGSAQMAALQRAERVLQLLTGSG